LIFIKSGTGPSISDALYGLRLRTSLRHLFLLEAGSGFFSSGLLLIIPGLIYGKYLLYLSRHEYATANSLVQQPLGSIKTVYSFTAEKRIIQKYTAILDKTIKLGIKQGIAKGLAVGFTSLSFAIWAFLAWHGGRLVMLHHASC
jgi:ATP-binding cassette subfamily B (MDR/TAP) protein 1